MSVSARYHLQLTVDETIGISADLATDPVSVHKIDSSYGTLTASSTVPATKVWSDRRTLSAGADSLDLTALAMPSSEPNRDFTGLKVQLYKIKAKSTNTSPIVFADSASNGYTLFGDSSGQVTLSAGAEILGYGNETLPDVSGSAKALTITSADADAIYDILLVAG